MCGSEHGSRDKFVTESAVMQGPVMQWLLMHWPAMQRNGKMAGIAWLEGS
ncbi:hypothetical protein X742_18575 [Mesorhizobium sp. LNHC232B00]|nr:hypothetical protein X742_18575 [Mesorhizobium sp. LNHC232B00]